MKNLDNEIYKATEFFWKTRDEQGAKQKIKGAIDTGSRSLVTGGKQMVFFEQLTTKLLVEIGFPINSIYENQKIELPGYYRSEKKWDLIGVDDGKLVFALEFKSQVGPSFGNNFNNRTEESIGSATDLWTAYRENAFKQSFRPWLGYFFLLEDCDKSRQPVKVKEPHFKVFPEFLNASYMNRYEILLNKLVLERLYDSSTLILSKRNHPHETIYCDSLTPANFFIQLKAHVAGYLELNREKL